MSWHEAACQQSLLLAHYGGGGGRPVAWCVLPILKASGPTKTRHFCPLTLILHSTAHTKSLFSDTRRNMKMMHVVFMLVVITFRKVGDPQHDKSVPGAGDEQNEP